MKLVLNLMVIALLGATACGPVCTLNQSRCNASYVETCSSDGQWQKVMCCDDVEDLENKNWVCCETELDGKSLHTCLPEDQCEEN